MESINLIGADDVRSAGNTMRHAAEDMRSAANSISESHGQFLMNLRDIFNGFISELKALDREASVSEGQIRHTSQAGDISITVTGSPELVKAWIESQDG